MHDTTCQAELHHRLVSALYPVFLKIMDQSHLHAHHQSNPNGAKHFKIIIDSPAFLGKEEVECHRLVYAAIGDLMQGAIHAVEICIQRQSPIEQQL